MVAKISWAEDDKLGRSSPLCALVRPRHFLAARLLFVADDTLSAELGNFSAARWFSAAQSLLQDDRSVGPRVAVVLEVIVATDPVCALSVRLLAQAAADRREAQPGSVPWCSAMRASGHGPCWVCSQSLSSAACS